MTTRHPPVTEGKVYGRLTAVAPAPSRGKHTYWKVVCSCGTLKEVAADHLKNGHTQSCGCYQAAQASAANQTHGGSEDPLYALWREMWSRCTNPRHKSFKDYSNRTPPDTWRDYSVFKTDVGLRPSPQHSLDRIKNELPYGPGNCRWATKQEQNRNRSDNRSLTFKGETKLLVEWAEELGITPGALYVRRHNGWSVERMLTTPLKGARGIKEHVSLN